MIWKPVALAGSLMRSEGLRAAASGLLAALLLLEVTLRCLGGWVRLRGSEPIRPGVRVVLCVGDSFTWGIGAHADRTWPAWLERMLNSQPGLRYQVVNRARAGSNSTHMVETLRQHIEEVRPDLVIMLTGSSNLLWHQPPGPALQARKALDRLRVFRLARLLAEDLKVPLASLQAQLWLAQHRLLGDGTPAQLYQRAWQALQHDDAPLAQALLEAHTAAVGLQAETCILLCEAALERGDRSQADRYHAAATQHAVDRPWLAPLLREKRKRLDDALRHPSGASILSATDSYFERLAERRAGRLPLPPNLVTARAWVARDLEAAMAICQESRTRVLLLNYPNQSASFAMEDASRRYQVPLVDVESTFRNLRQRERYFIDDGHCNDQGYEVMARTILPEVVRMLARPVDDCLPVLPAASTPTVP